MTRIAPGAAIGILGGGQLGRMLANAAQRLGFDVHIFTDEEDSPAARVAAKTIVADYHDHAALARFAHGVSVVTTEFENVPADTAKALVDAGALVRPNPQALAVAQDRLEEKTFFNANNIRTAPFAEVNTVAELETAAEIIGFPCILKTRRLGYDGRGQARLQSGEGLARAFESLGGARTILEGYCAFEREISIIAARGEDGAFAAYDLCENKHKNGILDRTHVPARCDDTVPAEARAEIRRVMDALDYVGVLTIEFFLMPDGALIANEMAPRVHNSGHWTIEAALTSQFEQHIRAIAGWPLGPTDRLCDAELQNLIGDDVNEWEYLSLDPTARLHLYGKRQSRPGRKMGHVTRLKR